jgi:hypothetical protein
MIGVWDPLGHHKVVNLIVVHNRIIAPYKVCQVASSSFKPLSVSHTSQGGFRVAQKMSKPPSS